MPHWHNLCSGASAAYVVEHPATGCQRTSVLVLPQPAASLCPYAHERSPTAACEMRYSSALRFQTRMLPLPAFNRVRSRSRVGSGGRLKAEAQAQWQWSMVMA